MRKKVTKPASKKVEDVMSKEHVRKTFLDISIKDYSFLTEVNVLDNCVYFNADVCDYEIERLIRYMEMLQFINENKTITIYINSGGGDVTSCLKFYDALRTRVKVPVDTIVEGISMSAATVMSVGATGKRYITPHSSMMFHQMSTVSIGKIGDEEQKLNWGKGLQEKIINLYKQHTKIKTDDEWKTILSTDTFFSADECKKNGFVDEVL